MDVPEGTEGAVRREYETKDGKKGAKHELVFDEMTGNIVGVSLHDGEYGTNLMVVFEKDGEELTLSLSTSQNYGEDVMKKLPNIDFDQEVTFKPYSFEDEKGKLRKGVSITQDGEKILSYFWDPKKEKSCNKFPEPKGDTKKYKKDDWKLYFLEARKFLQDYTEENIIPEFEKERVTRVDEDDATKEAMEKF